MAVTTYYTLKIGGTIGVPFDAISGIEKEWSGLFGQKPTNEGKDRVSREEEKAFNLDWPYGFLRPNGPAEKRTLRRAGGASIDLGGEWEVHEWKPGAEPAADGAYTKLTFDAEVEFEGKGGIDDHKESQKIAAEWFFDHVGKRWHAALREKLRKFNGDHKMIEPATFLEWEFYCGNGGGGGE